MTKVPSAQPDHFVHDRLPTPDALPTLHYDLPELQIADQVNLVQALFDRAEHAGHGGRPLLRGPQRTYTYREARAEVARIAEVLTQDHGLIPGNRVLLRGGNTVEMALAWLGTVYAGLIAVATMPLLRAGELSRIIERAQPLLALCDGRLLAELAAAQDQHPELATIVPFHTATDPADLLQRAQGKPGSMAPCPTSADDIALMAFTSGTTGAPKAAVHTHRDVLAGCEAWPRHVLKATPDDIVAGSPPLAFTFGLGGLLVFPMWAGASVYFPDQPYTPETMVTLMRDAGVTISYTAPTFYRQMAPFARKIGLPQLRISVSAGEGLPDATRQLWKDATGIDMTDGIGATEMFHIFISSAGNDVRRGAIGKVVPGYTA